MALLYKLKYILVREVRSPVRNGGAVLELLLENSIFLLNINKMLKLTCYMICLKLSLSMQNSWTNAGKAGYLGHLDVSPEKEPDQVGWGPSKYKSADWAKQIFQFIINTIDIFCLFCFVFVFFKETMQWLDHMTVIIFKRGKKNVSKVNTLDSLVKYFLNYTVIFWGY